MKKDTHPKYFEEAKIACACGKVYVVGSTKPEINVEVCANCHPFFTGKDKLLDVAGRIEKFKTKVAKSKEIKSSVTRTKKEKRQQKSKTKSSSEKSSLITPAKKEKRQAKK